MCVIQPFHYKGRPHPRTCAGGRRTAASRRRHMLIARTCAEGEAAHGTKVAAQLSLIGGQPGLSRWPSVSTGVLIRGRQGSGVRVPGMLVRRSPSQCCPLWGWKGPEPGDAGSCGSWRTGCCPGASGKGSRQANRVLQPREARFRLGTSRTVRQWVCVAASRGVCGLLSQGGGWRLAQGALRFGFGDLHRPPRRPLLVVLSEGVETSRESPPAAPLCGPVRSCWGAALAV